MNSDSTIRKLAEADFPTRWGHFRITGFEGMFEGYRLFDPTVALEHAFKARDAEMCPARGKIGLGQLADRGI